MAYDHELKTALSLMEDVARLALRYRAEGVTAEDKPDDSPVTIADRECEKLIVSTLDRAFPADGLLGEEGANKDSRSGRRWIIDPIDGTRDFLRNIPTWCSLLALEVDGRVELGVAKFPVLGDCYWAVRGQGAHRNGEQVRISAITDPARSVGCINQIQNAYERPFPDKILELLTRFWAIRCFGGALDAMLVCSGSAEFWLEPYAKPWDLAVIQVMAEESGAAYFDYTGANTIYGSNAILCVPALVPTARWFLDLDSEAKR